MLVDERVELGDERRMPAERELGVDALLNGPEPHLLQPLHLDACERLELEVCERAAAPQPLGPSQELGRGSGIAGRKRLSCRHDEPFEELDIKLVRLDPQEISRRTCHEPWLLRPRRQHLAQARNVVPQRMIGGVHALLREELGDEAIARDHAVRAQQQQREERPLLRPPGRDLRVVDPDAERSQDPELETPSHRAFKSPPRRTLFPLPETVLGQAWDTRVGTSRR